MLINYTRLTVRNLLSSKGRVYFLINLLGLIIGIVAFILAALWIQAETSYDKFHENAENIYRVEYMLYEEGILEQHSAGGSPAIGKELVNAFPEVVDYTRFYKTEALVNRDELIFKESNILYGQSSFFDVFTFPLVEGVTDSNILALNHAVLTEESARKYFGDEDPIGKTINVNWQPFEVAGVARNVPANSHFTFDILLSYENMVAGSPNYWDNGWVSEVVYNYIVLAPGTNLTALAAKIPQVPQTFIGDFMERAFFRIDYPLTKLTDIHLHSDLANELGVNGSYRSVISLGLVAVLVLVIAFINYVNLATSRAMERANEIGVRKVAGALRTDIVAQFITESALVNLLALVISISGVLLLFSTFRQIMQSPIEVTYGNILILCVTLLVTGSVLTGMIPAVYMARLAPVLVLKGKGQTGSKLMSRFKNGLVIFQFAISVLLIIGTLTISRQLDFMRHYDLGIDIDQVLVVEGPRAIRVNTMEEYNTLIGSIQNEVLAQAAVSDVTFSSSVPGGEVNGHRVLGVPVEGRNTEKRIDLYQTDNRFFSSYGLEIVAGRGFAATPEEDVRQIILNESALAYYEFESPETAIGRILTGGTTEYTIIGVVNDFNQESLKELPSPIAFFHQDNPAYFSIKANMTGISQLIPAVETAWRSIFPGNPFNYFFMDEYYNEQYRADQRFAGLFLTCCILAIFIACLGLLGLSAYAIARRTKEIGIRKVVGASIAQMVALLCKEFLVLVVIANVIAWPLAWYVMNRWLQGFAYRIDLGLGVFILAGLLTFLIALATVSWQTIRAATADPVEALRYE